MGSNTLIVYRCCMKQGKKKENTLPHLATLLWNVCCPWKRPTRQKDLADSISAPSIGRVDEHQLLKEEVTLDPVFSEKIEADSEMI